MMKNVAFQYLHMVFNAADPQMLPKLFTFGGIDLDSGELPAFQLAEGGRELQRGNTQRAAQFQNMFGAGQQYEIMQKLTGGCGYGQG